MFLNRYFDQHLEMPFPTVIIGHNNYDILPFST